MFGIQSGKGIGSSMLPFGIVSSIRSAVPPAPVHWWKFNEASGNSAADSAGTMTLTSAAAVWTTINSQPAINVAGGNSFVAAAIPTQWIGGSTPFSVSLWLNAAAATGASAQSLLTTIGPSNGQEVTLDGNGGITIFFDGGFPAAASVFTWTGMTNGIHHIVVTVDGTYTAAGTKAYLDGVSLGLPTVSPANYHGTPTPFGGDTNLSFGARTTPAQVFNGAMSDVRMYASALNAAQALTLKNAGPA